MSGKNKKELKKSVKDCSSALQTFSEDFAEALRNNTLSNHLTEEADADLQMKISGILSGDIEPNESYEDGDQSPLKGDEAQFLRNQWASGMDYMPHIPFFTHLSSWLKVIYSGNYERFLKIIENKSGAELTEMLERRETLQNVSAIFHVIIGARMSDQIRSLPIQTLEMKDGHLKIFIKLLSFKVDIHARDVAGFTPLHHCCNGYGNEVTKKMAELLLNEGADINARNRFGTTPLQEVSMCLQYDFITFLLDKGADPHIKDNDGCSAAGNAHMNPKLKEIFGKKYTENVKISRVWNLGESKEICGYCGDKKKERKKCTGCYHIWYCNKECQLQHWEEHKEDCKKILAEYKACKFKSQWISTLSSISGKVGVHDPKTRPKKSHFVVKIQVPLFMGDFPDQTRDLAVYNKDKSFNVAIQREGNEAIHKELCERINSEGVKGMKGYFHAILEKKKGKEVLKINSTRIGSPEAW